MSLNVTKNTFYTLNNGVKIPINALGLYKTAENEASTIVQQALKVGYRHFDTAKFYAKYV
jgi:diketogulonate reductase-like aldo/keto reductase